MSNEGKAMLNRYKLLRADPLCILWLCEEIEDCKKNMEPGEFEDYLAGIMEIFPFYRISSVLGSTIRRALDLC